MASWHDAGEALPLKAAADLSAKQYYAVKVDSNREYALCSAGTDKIAGSLQNKPEAGQVALVYNRGTFPVKLGDTVAIGDLLTADSNGAWVATTTSNDIVAAKATQAGSAGDVIIATGVDIRY